MSKMSYVFNLMKINLESYLKSIFFFDNVDLLNKVRLNFGWSKFVGYK